MKKRRLLSFILTVLLVLGFDMSAFAENEIPEEQAGLLDVFADILETDFNPSLRLSKEELVQKYKLVPTSPDYDDEFFTSIRMLDQDLYCVLYFDDEGELDYGYIGTKEASASMEDIFQYVAESEEITEVIPVEGYDFSSKTIQMIAKAYYTKSDHTIVIDVNADYEGQPLCCYIFPFLLNTEASGFENLLLVTEHVIEVLRNAS